MENYEKWSIVISLLGAFATFLAVVVALWQTKYTNKKKVKLESTEVISFLQDLEVRELGEFNFRLLQINVVNIGNRKVVMNKWGLYFSKNLILQIVNIKDKSLPFELDIEQSKLLNLPMLIIRSALKENNEIISKYLKRKMRIIIWDTAGKKHILKTKRKICDYITMSDSELFFK